MVRIIAAVAASLIAFAFHVSPAGAQKPSPARPLIFVPGMFGTKLCRAYDRDTEVWGTLRAFAHFTEMRLDETGGGVKLVPCGELKEFVYFGPIGQGVYGSFLDQLSKAGFIRGENLFVFSYDWRLSCSDNARELDKFVADIIKDKHFDANIQFDILAHSLGGLVSTYFVNKYDIGSQRIRRLITVGTPFFGSVEFFESLDRGWGAIPKLYVSMPDVRKTVLSFPSIYEVLPRYKNCCGLGAEDKHVAFDTLAVKDWLRLSWVRESGLTEDILASHIKRVRELDDVLQQPQSRVTVIRLVGSRVWTPEQVYLVDGADADPSKTIHLLRKAWDGDGVVLKLSATAGIQPATLSGMVAHDQLMSDPTITKQLFEMLADLRLPQPIRGESVIVATTGGTSIEVSGIGIVGDKRLMRAGDDGEVTVALRSSRASASAKSLSKIVLAGNVVDADGSRRQFSLQPAGEAEFGSDVEGAYLSVELKGKFQAPLREGHASIVISFQNGASSSWDFGVVP